MMLGAPASPMFRSWRRSRETGPFLLLNPPALFASSSGCALRSAGPLARTVWCRCLCGRLTGATARDDEHAAAARVRCSIMAKELGESQARYHQKSLPSKPTPRHSRCCKNIDCSALVVSVMIRAGLESKCAVQNHRPPGVVLHITCQRGTARTTASPLPTRASTRSSFAARAARIDALRHQSMSPIPDTPMQQQPEARMAADLLIVGAGPAGLAVAGALKHLHPDIRCILLEADNVVGSTWHKHYDRLHLHSSKAVRHGEVQFGGKEDFVRALQFRCCFTQAAASDRCACKARDF